MKTARSLQPLEKLFALTDEGAVFRSRVKTLAFFVLWIVLSGLTMLLTVLTSGATGATGKLTLIAMSLIKYIPMLMVVYSLSRHMAAKYLNDVYELDNEPMAEDFLEHVAFSQSGSESASPKLIIENGMIDEAAERSQLILIGGPGYIQVNLDSAALLEKVTGEPEVIYPKTGVWRLGCFERIREIGESDKIGEREYAIINLREQRIKDLKVSARTKDGIPVEARDVKIKFSALGYEDEHGDFHVDENAVKALIYQQTTITPPEKVYPGAGFPWNTTIIPLIISEIERVISSHTADEIAVGVGQRELESNADIEQTAAQVRGNVTGKIATKTTEAKVAASVESRDKINNLFYQKEFTDKAAKMGVQINWIDIGTWQPIGPIREKIRNAWALARQNTAKLNNIKKTRAQLETSETLNLIDSVINPLHERISTRTFSRQKDAMLTPKDLQELAEKNPALGGAFMPSLTTEISHKNAAVIAKDMLKIFRKELLAGRAQIINKESEGSEEEKRAQIAKIEAALRHINSYFPIAKPE